MSEENVSCVEAAFRAFESDGLDGFMSHWTDDADHRAIKGAPDDRGPMQGKDEVRAYIEDWLDTFDDVATEIVELIDAGDDKVVAVLKASGKAKLSGISTELTYAVVYSVRDGKIARGREYATRDEAVEAAGLRE